MTLLSKTTCGTRRSYIRMRWLVSTYVCARRRDATEHRRYSVSFFCHAAGVLGQQADVLRAREDNGRQGQDRAGARHHAAQLGAYVLCHASAGVPLDPFIGKLGVVGFSCGSLICVQTEKLEESGWMEPAGIHLVPLPFADDIRAAPVEQAIRGMVVFHIPCPCSFAVADCPPVGRGMHSQERRRGGSEGNR